MDLLGILQDLAVPRPNGSAALDATRERLVALLEGTGVSVSVEPFIVRPHMQALVGLALLALAVGVVLAVRGRRLGIALLLAALIPAIYLLEFERGYPVVSWLGQKPAYNIVVDWSPGAAGDPGSGTEERPLVILAAHYDSKTEVFDHRARQPIYSAAPGAMAALLLVALLGLAAEHVGALGCFTRGPGRTGLLAVAVAATAVIALLAFSFAGGHLLPRKSPGACDDGTAVAILAGLAADLPSLGLSGTDVRIILFTGEEVNCQGSAAYVAGHPELADRARKGTVRVINLECLGGEGELSYSRAGGTFLRRYAASAELVGMIDQALAEHGSPPLKPAPFSYDDARSFMAAGVPAVTVCQVRPDHGDSYHNAGDDLSKVVPGEMERVLAVLKTTLQLIDRVRG